MTKEEELQVRRSELKKKILTLEWDKKHRQINFSKNSQLEDLRAEFEEISKKLNKNEDK